MRGSYPYKTLALFPSVSFISSVTCPSDENSLTRLVYLNLRDEYDINGDSFF